MAHREILINGKPLTVHKAVTHPEFGGKTILVTDAWDYIDLWLKRNRHTSARFYWDQARSFYVATKALPKESSPLTSYYCMLNATKALLNVKRIAASDEHGVTGYETGAKTLLSNQHVKFKTGGILAALAQHVGDPPGEHTYTLRDLLYNLPFIHRAFDLSVESSPELFIPIRNPRVLRARNNDEAWFCATLEGRYASLNTVGRLPTYFEQDISFDGEFVVRSRRRFDWVPRQKKASLARYVAYHGKLRMDVQYIHGNQRLWYIKRNDTVQGHIARSTMSITFAAMHRLSEMSRYDPEGLVRLFGGRYNWLLSEFLAIAPSQFIDEISCEMTGHEFMPPGRVAR